MQVNPRGLKVQEKMLPKVSARNVMFKRKATKVSIGGTEQQASKHKNGMMNCSYEISIQEPPSQVRATLWDGTNRDDLHLKARLASINETGC